MHHAKLKGIEIIVSEDDVAVAAQCATQPQIPIKGVELREVCCESAQAPEPPPAEAAQLAAGTLLPVGCWLGLLSADGYGDLSKGC